MRPPAEVIKQFKGICPRCGNKLSFDPKNIKIVILGNGGAHQNG